MVFELKIIYKLFAGTCLLFLLGGCIGEDYDFSPPTVRVSAYDTANIALKEANLDWHGEDNKSYKKGTKDIIKLGKEQEALTVESGTDGYLEFDSEDFAVKGLTAYVVDTNKQEIKLDKTDRSFNFPKEKGKYVFVVLLNTDIGSAQYVGNIVVK